jgi:hypothetical protein
VHPTLPSALCSYDASPQSRGLVVSGALPRRTRLLGITFWLLALVHSFGRRRASPATPTTPPNGWPSLRDFGRAIGANSAPTSAPSLELGGVSPEVAHPRDADVLLRSFLRSPWLARSASGLLLLLSPRVALAKDLSDQWNDYWREYGLLTGVTAGGLLLWALGWVVLTTLGRWRAEERATRHAAVVRAEYVQHVAVHGNRLAHLQAADAEATRLRRKRQLLATLDRGLRARLQPLGLTPNALLDATWGQPFHADGTPRELSAEELFDWLSLHDWRRQKGTPDAAE